MTFKDKRALITGGSDGIGLATGKLLREKGCRVALMARNPEKLAAAAAEIGALSIPGDVARAEDARGAVERTVAEFGGIDILVNNAGIGTWGPLVELDIAEFDRVFAVNVRGALLVTQAAAPHMIRHGSGNILNIASTSGLKGSANGTIYCSSKFALRGMTECWRDELRRHNIRVTLVNPSEVQTNFFVANSLAPRPESPKKLRSQEIAAAIVGALEIDDRGFIPEFSVFATNPF
ncbi:MAG TPA: SDR family oxidoreductase [Candidatus Eisenbacteria bacterium]